MDMLGWDQRILQPFCFNCYLWEKWKTKQDAKPKKKCL
jgi:hypothetical protein